MRKLWWAVWVAVVVVVGMGAIAEVQAEEKVKDRAKPGVVKREPAQATARKAPTRRPAPPRSEMVGAKTGEALYRQLLAATQPGSQQPKLVQRLRKASLAINWANAKDRELVGNLRLLQKDGARDLSDKLFLLRKTTGEVFVVALPKDEDALKKGAKSPYADFYSQVRHKMKFQVKVATQEVSGQRFSFAKLTAKPKRQLLDRLFFIAIVLLLFLVMVGMGLTLTTRDFALVFIQPRGVLVGPICQFLLLPLVAFALGKLMGFADNYPYIFAGLILVSASPGGVTSNLMTYLGKGDVALSVSLTAFSTVLSIVFTPLLLTLYVTNIPEVSIPVGDIIKVILVLVLLPLAVGMFVRSRAEGFAKRSEKFFSWLGVFALLFLIVVGVWGNLDKFADTTRYGFKFYITVFLVTFFGMLLGIALSKILRVPNFQIRAISLETGLQNASLAMTIAILLQDRMGDFYSSMFFTSGIFGLWMYAAGAIVIALFPVLLPLPGEEATT